MILRISCSDRISDEQHRELQRITGMPCDRYDKDYEYSFLREHLKGTFQADPAELVGNPILKGLGFLLQTDAVEVTLVASIFQRLKQLDMKLQEFHVKLDGLHTVEGQQFNDRLHVHVPGLGLMMVNETLLIEDACTNDVQRHLDEGWRILAVMPQPDQRRPDYIFGRTRP